MVPVSFTTRLQFAGIIVVSDNLQPKPSSADAAAAAVSEFIQLDGLQNPRSEEWRYVLDPQPSSPEFLHSLDPKRS